MSWKGAEFNCIYPNIKRSAIILLSSHNRDLLPASGHVKGRKTNEVLLSDESIRDLWCNILNQSDRFIYTHLCLNSTSLNSKGFIQNTWQPCTVRTFDQKFIPKKRAGIWDLQHPVFSSKIKADYKGNKMNLMNEWQNSCP